MYTNFYKVFKSKIFKKKFSGKKSPQFADTNPNISGEYIQGMDATIFFQDLQKKRGRKYTVTSPIFFVHNSNFLWILGVFIKRKEKKLIAYIEYRTYFGSDSMSRLVDTTKIKIGKMRPQKKKTEKKKKNDLKKRELNTGKKMESTSVDDCRYNECRP